MADLHGEKAALRQKLREVREKFTKEERAEWDAAIFAQLTALKTYNEANTIFCYVSVGTEPDTRRFINKAITDGKTVCVPRCISAGTMEARKITGFDDLKAAPLSLLEPDIDAEFVHQRDIELVVAPCVATGQKGERLGNGGGYYDHYLQYIHCALVCICYEELVQPTLPMGRYDAYMDAVISEKAIHYRGLAETFI